MISKSGVSKSGISKTGTSKSETPKTGISKSGRSNILLLITALIWGSAFVAQRVGMDHVGPFTFNGVRFLLGALTLVPLLILTRRQRLASMAAEGRKPADAGTLLWGGALAGVALYLGASLQQAGLVYTTAGKAGFITGLYVIIVPLMGLIWRQRPDLSTWIGAVLATWGMYLLSVTEHLTIEFGDLLVLLGAFFWAAHVHVLAWLSPRIHPIRLAFCQFLACALFSLATAAATEVITMDGLRAGAAPIFYGGVCSVGIAYTLQVVAQRHARPAHAAIILSLEAAFAALFGWILLAETLSIRGMAGCALMLGGMLLSQFRIPLNLIALTRGWLARIQVLGG